MFRSFISKLTTYFFVIFVTLWSCFPVFAWLAKDDHAPDKLAVDVSVTIDSLYYDTSGAGVAYLSGSFFVYNFHPVRTCSYDGELRLEILKPLGDGKFQTHTPDSKENVDGTLEENDDDARVDDIYDSFSKSTNIHVDCLDPKPIAGVDYIMSASITLNVTQWGTTEPWGVNDPPYESGFTYLPEMNAEEPHGLGPTKDGETFSGDCTSNLNNESDWQSLMITDTAYSSVYWYVKAPGDTSEHGTWVETDHGDGVVRNATMTYTFPDDVPGTGASYEITAYVYRWDQSVYWDSYKVWVEDK